MCHLRLKPGLAHFYRQVSTVGEVLPETLPPCFVLEMFISVVLQLLMILHKVHNSHLIQVCELDIGHVPLLVTVMVPPLLQPMFWCHFSPFWAFFLQRPPLVSVFPPLLPTPSWSPPSVSVPLPILLAPSPPSSAEYLPLYPPAQIQEHHQLKILSSNFYQVRLVIFITDLLSQSI